MVSALFAITVLVCFADGRLGLMTPGAGVVVGLIGHVSGIAFAAIWRFGRPALFAALLGAFLAHFTATGNWEFSLPAALANVLPALAGCRVLERLGVRDPFRDPMALMKFFGMGVLLVPLLSASIGVAGAWANGMPAESLAPLGLAWWAGDVVGMMVVAPLLLGLFEKEGVPSPRPAAPEWALLAAVCSALAWLLFLPPAGRSGEAAVFGILPLVVWAALRFPFTAVGALLYGWTAATAWATAHGLGPFADASLFVPFAPLPFFVVAMAGIGLTVNVMARTSRRSLEEATTVAAECQRNTQRLRGNEERFRATFDQAEVGLAHLDVEGRWRQVNRKLCGILGYSPDELLSLPLEDLVHPEDLPVNRENFRRMLAGELSTHKMEKRLRSKSGDYVWVNFALAPMSGSMEEPRYVIAVVEDITEQKQSLDRIRQRRDRLARQQASLVALIRNEIFFLAEPEQALGLLAKIAAQAMTVRRVSVWNSAQEGQAVRCLANFDAESGPSSVEMEISAERYPAYFDALSRLDAVVADDARQDPATCGLWESYLEPLGVGALLATSVRLFGRLCGVLCFEHGGSTRHWEDEERLFALSVANLVSLIFEHWERRRAEAALHASELSWRETLQNAPNVAIQWYAADGRILYWNSASESLYGWSGEEALDKTRDQLMPDPGQAKLFQATLGQVLNTGKPASPTEYMVRRRDGSPLVVQSTLFAVPGAAGESAQIVCMEIDVTESRRIRDELRQRGRILEMVAFATERLLRSTDWADEIPAVLAHLGLAADVDRVALFENHEEPNEIWARQRFEWVGPGRLKNGTSVCQSLPLQEAGFGRWVKILRRGGMIAGKVREFPDSERESLPLRNMLSVAVAPVFARQRWWGFLVFSNSRTDRAWSTVELDALKAVANNLGTALGRQQAETSLRLAATAFETSEGIMITDPSGIILRVNHAFCKLTGYSSEELVGNAPTLLRSDRHDAAFFEAVRKRLREKGDWEGEVWNRLKDGGVAPHWVSVKPVWDDAGGITHYVATFLDISERKRAEQEVIQLAYYDPLTGLPNRRLLIDRLQHAVAAARRDGSYGALMFVDLDNFKHLNDAMGHLMGDLLLKQAARRMHNVVREHDTIGRLGGDEFLVLLENLSAQTSVAVNRARRVAEKIVAALNRPFALGDYEHRITASIGVVLFPESGSTAEDILKQADTAMYRAKAGGRNTLRFFEPAMQAAAEIRLEMEKALRDGIAGGEFEIYLQPQMQSSREISSSEVLVRWNRPGYGTMAPHEFMAVAEESGLIVPLGKGVLEAACRMIRIHREAGRPLGISINISPREFRGSNFVERVREALEQTGADPARLTLELTESTVTEDISDSTRKMNQLCEWGIRFAVDDFGTGYSSLAYLKQLPISEIKIDRSFIADVVHDPNDAAIVDAALAMASRLGLKVIIEGVESAEQVQLLEQLGCRFFQGFFFCPPLPVDDYFAFLRAQDAQEQKS